MGERKKSVMQSLPHTRGDESEAHVTSGFMDQGLPHTRGDEPARLSAETLPASVCPTRVGMNREARLRGLS